MARDNSPVKNTCPLIDQAIDMYMANVEDGYQNQIFQELMEKIRSMNLELREWGNDEYLRAEDLQKDCDMADSTIEDLRLEITNKQTEIDQLETQIYN